MDQKGRGLPFSREKRSECRASFYAEADPFSICQEVPPLPHRAVRFFRESGDGSSLCGSYRSLIGGEKGLFLGGKRPSFRKVFE